MCLQIDYAEGDDQLRSLFNDTDNEYILLETGLHYNLASEGSPTLGCSIEISRDIGECGSTLYVGLSGIVRNLIQKSMV